MGLRGVFDCAYLGQFLPSLYRRLMGYAAARQQPGLGGERLSVISIGVAGAVLVIQIFLWWLLYYVPTLNHGM